MMIQPITQLSQHYNMNLFAQKNKRIEHLVCQNQTQLLKLAH